MTATGPEQRRCPGPAGSPIVLGDPAGDRPAAAREARLVAAMLGVTPLLGADACRRALLGGGEPVIMHVAGPALRVLTGDDMGPRARILVLSGCSGDEPARRRARAVVAAEWDVASVERFYQALAWTATVGEAAEFACTSPGSYTLWGDAATDVRDHVTVSAEDVRDMRRIGATAFEHLARDRVQPAIGGFEETLEMMTRLLGPDHPDTLATAGGLAAAYAEAGRLTEAIPLLESTLAEATRTPAAGYLIETLRGNLELARKLHQRGS